MKTVVLTIVLIVILSIPSKANVDCVWTSSQSGVRIQYVTSCHLRSKVFLDSFLTKTLISLDRRDTSLKILVLINNGKLSFPGAALSNFISIGYDTLREIDNDFIFKFYWSWGSIIDTRNNPIDINATNDKTANDVVGIKIIYDEDYRLEKPHWDEVSRLIIYAVKNADKVRQAQIRDTVRYNVNGWYVSLVTIDTSAINTILGRSHSISMPQTKAVVTSYKPYFITGAICAVAILVSWVVVKRTRSS